MQHDHVLKKLNFDLLTSSQGRGGGYGRGICGQNICYHVAALVILFNLICNMTHVLKKLNFDLLTPTPGSGCVCVCGGGGGGRELGRGLGAKYLLPCFCIRDSL